MDFINLAEKRYSVRNFSNKPVEKEKLDLVLEAGRLAPTTGNIQPQRILVIESAAAIDKLKEAEVNHYNAPTTLLVCYDNDVKNPFTGMDAGAIDAAIAATYMTLEAASLGLGAVWIGYFNPEVAKTAFSIPENMAPLAFLAIGYPAEGAAPGPEHSQRLPIEKTVFYGRFPA